MSIHTGRTLYQQRHGHSDDTPAADYSAAIAAMSDTRMNRGRLEAYTRFGSDTDRRAARAKLTEWQRADADRRAGNDPAA